MRTVTITGTAEATRKVAHACTHRHKAPPTHARAHMHTCACTRKAEEEVRALVKEKEERDKQFQQSRGLYMPVCV